MNEFVVKSEQLVFGKKDFSFDGWIKLSCKPKPKSKCICKDVYGMECPKCNGKPKPEEMLRTVGKSQSIQKEYWVNVVAIPSRWWSIKEWKRANEFLRFIREDTKT